MPAEKAPLEDVRPESIAERLAGPDGEVDLGLPAAAPVTPSSSPEPAVALEPVGGPPASTPDMAGMPLPEVLPGPASGVALPGPGAGMGSPGGTGTPGVPVAPAGPAPGSAVPGAGTGSPGGMAPGAGSAVPGAGTGSPGAAVPGAPPVGPAPGSGPAVPGSGEGSPGVGEGAQGGAVPGSPGAGSTPVAVLPSDGAAPGSPSGGSAPVGVLPASGSTGAVPGSPDGGSASDSGSAEPGASGEEAPEWPADEPDDGSASANDDAEDSGSADDDASSDSEKDPAEDDSVESGGSEEASGSHEQAQNMSAPAKADGWQVDPYQLRAFGDAVLRARSYLETVRAKVDLMQGAELTPQLGTSPVGTQLAKKFDDRLNSADGLRARLAEAMTRMEQLVASAEKAASSYEELEETSVQSYGNVEVKNG